MKHLQATAKRRSTADIASQTVTQLSLVLSSTPQLTSSYSPLSPAKVRSKQLGELKSLNQAGILYDEYGTERKAIMEILKPLKTGKY